MKLKFLIFIFLLFLSGNVFADSEFIFYLINPSSNNSYQYSEDTEGLSDTLNLDNVYSLSFVNYMFSKYTGFGVNIKKIISNEEITKDGNFQQEINFDSNIGDLFINIRLPLFGWTGDFFYGYGYHYTKLNLLRKNNLTERSKEYKISELKNHQSYGWNLRFFPDNKIFLGIGQTFYSKLFSTDFVVQPKLHRVVNSLFLVGYHFGGKSQKKNNQGSSNLNNSRDGCSLFGAC